MLNVSLPEINIQELLIKTYTEELERWQKDLDGLEKSINIMEEAINKLEHQKDKWWERIIKLVSKRLTSREKEIINLDNQLDILRTKHIKRNFELPRAEAYELAMLGNNIFKIK